MFDVDLLINALTMLLVTLDPPGLAPIFLSLTVGMSRQQRFQVATRGSLIAFFILAAFALFGDGILGLLGISIGAFRIAGGMLLFWIAFEMIFEKRQERKEKAGETAITKDHLHNIAVFPLALPLIAGPGAISATILLGSSFPSALERVQLIVVIAASMAILFLALVIAERIDRFLGVTGRAILTRLLGVILAALAVQFVVDGVRSAFQV
ncbi:NAAT family transporter [Sinorhizobium meliloti]|uniref:MarC family protein n=1 Tax=Rhizobium meliloti TaxID=382 RepID=UPI00299ED10A|nr:NAAT family transporter [Sinorhizobium meliloti]MDW9872935.1 NAAT family transporter [Sinorhizobium meliloti]MDW9885756.1 NAAT family transporter [Sinorhizobium meliloti]MDX0207634.1 NAAT family transporter [Sinorhizobium meliloti]